ncbi:ester cyclase [Sphaerimonospora cavernae]|uniref:Ester cyclase n=1 Tax=Sphaerimonospora cavernae TaxID=1740611 RepID=A0ABV6U9Z6_9ACTN
MPDVRDLVDLVLGALNDHDVERALRHFSSDAVLVSPIGVAEGHGEIAWYFEHLIKGFPDLGITVWHKVTCEDPMFTEWTMTGTHTGPFLLPRGEVLDGTGRRIAVRGCGACAVEDGLVITYRDYFDQLELYVQLGLSLELAGDLV